MKFEIHNYWILTELFIGQKSYNHNVTFGGNVLKTFHKLPTYVNEILKVFFL